MEATYSFGYWVRRRRRALDLTQDDLARQVGCVASMIKKIEADERRPSRQLAERLAEYLSIPAAEREQFMQAARGQLTVDQLELATQPLPSPARTSAARRHNLPIPQTSLIGRAQEIAAVGVLLRQASTRLVTLTGPGGIGKTRLALALAAELVDAFANGVWLVELAPVADPALMPQAVVSAMGLRVESGRALLDALAEYLRDRAALILLDNCEHVVEATARMANTLLRECADVRILATSREALGIAGETTIQVPPLSIPSLHERPLPDQLTRSDAGRLFVERATAVLPAFVIGSNNAAALAQICRRLDGIPLAIELAAARIGMLRVEQIAARLDDAIGLLTRGSRTALPHQQTLRATMDWSYDLLADAERVLLRRLAIFAGGWMLEAAEAISIGDHVSQLERPSEDSKPVLQTLDVLDVLALLANKSLVIADRTPGSEARYRMLEPIRQYAREKLVAAGETEHVAERHLAYYVQLTERVEQAAVQPAQWLNQLQAEMDNIRAALDWSVEHDPASGLRLASAVWRFCFRYGFIGEHRERLTRLLMQPAAAHTWMRAKGLAAAARLVAWEDFVRARALAEESLAIARELRDPKSEALSLVTLGTIACLMNDFAFGRPLVLQSLELYQALGHAQGMASVLLDLGITVEVNDYGRARAYLEEALALYREQDDLIGMADVLESLGDLCSWNGDLTVARRWLEESMALQHQLSGQTSAFTLNSLGTLALRQGEYAQARAYFDEGLAICRDAGNATLGHWLLAHLGYVVLREGDEAQARARFDAVLQLFLAAGITSGVVYTLEGLASLATRQSEPERAVRLLAWADMAREAIDDARPPVEQADVDRDLAAIRSQLDEALFAAAWAAGQAMTIEQAIAEALDS
jgi:predicted ATPase/transcriptional regulator with XRE-family HTH domain